MPVEIQGYAVAFGQVARWHDGSHIPLTVQRGAFDNFSEPVQLWEAHSGHAVFASTDDASLEIWGDDYGLAFRATVDNDRHAVRQIVADIVLGTWALVSVCHGDARKGSIQQIDGEQVEIVTKGAIDEISIVPEAACPGTGVWVAGSPGLHANLARHWRTGFQARALAKARRQVPAAKAKRATMPASVLALMRSPKWKAGAAQNAAAGLAMQRHGLQGGGAGQLSGALA